MSRPVAYFVELLDSSGEFAYARWQSRWIEESVTWNNNTWKYQRMIVSGILSGNTLGSQTQLNVPLTIQTDSLSKALEYPPGIIKIEEYHLNDSLPLSAPQVDQILVNQTLGNVTQVSKTTSEVQFTIGLALSPGGSSFVPRRATTRLIGLGITL